MLPISTFQLSMHISMRALPMLIALALLVSCTKNDHDVVVPPSECLFLGKTSVADEPGSSVRTKVTSSTDVKFNDQKQLLSSINVYKTEELDSNNAALVRRTETVQFDLSYDADGFLTKLIRRKVFLFEGIKAGTFLFEQYKFKNFRREDLETSDYKYESGHVASSTTQRQSTFLGNNVSLPVVESSESKVYQYDGNGKPISAVTTATYGSALTTFKNGVISSVVEKNLNGTVTTDTKYNEMGFVSSITNAQSVFEITYDARGNMTSVQSSTNGQKASFTELFYDDHKNPENDIPKNFKGIPELISTAQRTDGANNLIGDKTTLFPSNQVFETKTTYQYNSFGLPESSAHTSAGAPEGSAITTTFNYKCP